MLRNLADTIQALFAPYEFTVLTHRFYRGLYFHISIAVHNPAAGTVFGQFQRHFIAHHHLDVTQTHTSRQIRQHNSAVIYLYTKRSIRQRLYDGAGDFLLFLVVQGYSIELTHSIV